MTDLTTLVEHTGLACTSHQSNDAYRQRVEEMQKSDTYYQCPDSAD